MENNTVKATSLPLSIHGETFNALKYDFDAALRGLVGTMIAKGSEEAKISIGLKITLAKDQAPDESITAYAASRDVVIPKFEHKIKSTITINEQREGFLGGTNYELVYDKEQGYVLLPIKDLENRLFDPDTVNDEPEELPEEAPDEDYVCPARADLSCDTATECGRCCEGCVELPICTKSCEKVGK